MRRLGARAAVSLPPRMLFLVAAHAAVAASAFAAAGSPDESIYGHAAAGSPDESIYGHAAAGSPDADDAASSPNAATAAGSPDAAGYAAATAVWKHTDRRDLQARPPFGSTGMAGTTLGSRAAMPVGSTLLKRDGVAAWNVGPPTPFWWGAGAAMMVFESVRYCDGPAGQTVWPRGSR